MSSNLQKLQLTYDQPQDRLILTFYTQDFSEYRFWITRRMLQPLWDILKQVSQMLSKNELQKREVEKKVQEQIQQEKTQPEASKYATRMTKRPLGEEPLLLFKVMARPLENGQAHFHLEDPQGKNIEFSGDTNLVTGLIQIIQRTAPQTGWGITLV